MTLLLDLAALLLLALALTFAPLQGVRHDARLDRQIRAADRERDRRAGARAAGDQSGPH